MALSIDNQPDQYHPIHHDIDWLIDSTIKANDQFRYLFLITASGFTTRTIKIAPRPGDGKGELNLEQHIRDFLLTDVFDLSQNLPLDQAAPYVDYSVQIGEEFKDGAGVIQTILGATAVNRVGFNSILTRFEILKPYLQNDFKLNNVSSKFLVNMQFSDGLLWFLIFWVVYYLNNIQTIP